MVATECFRYVRLIARCSPAQRGLPSPVYVFLSGLNASAVGIIALAAVQLSRKAITDKLTRALVVSGGCAGLLYNALWYFPVLLVGASIITILWDICVPQILRYICKRHIQNASFGNGQPTEELEMAEMPNVDVDHVVEDRSIRSYNDALRVVRVEKSPLPNHRLRTLTVQRHPALLPPTDVLAYGMSVRSGLVLIILFFVLFAVLIALRSALSHPPLPLALFNNMFLAGTIIFGGGPVVIPLLREYVVQPGWVTPRDFILGLAIAQASPGPNFDFAVYLGSLAIASVGYTPAKSFFGAMIGYLGIFTPGVWLSIGFQSLWRTLRKQRVVTSLLKGVNAAVVVFVYTAVYRIWQVGYLTPTQNQSISLGNEPWWLVVSATTFTLVEWYKFPPAVTIILGGLAGLGWWGVVIRQ